MKKLIYLFLILGMICMTSCSNDQNEYSAPEDSDSLCVFRLNLNTGFSTSTMTRSVTNDLASTCTNIDVYFTAAGNKSLIAEAHQVNTDENFGSITIGLPKGLFNIYTYAHNGGTITRYNDVQYAISYPSYFFGDTFQKNDPSVSITTDTDLNWTLTRIVSKFKLTLTDNRIPDKVTKMRIKVKGVASRYIPGSDVLDEDIATDYVYKDFDITTHTEKNFEVILLPKVTSTENDISSGTCDIIVESLTDNGSVLESRSFTGVILGINYITTYTGSMFSSTYGSFTFSINPAWNEYTAISF